MRPKNNFPTYKYPVNMTSTQRHHYQNISEAQTPEKDPFNPEKEHQILNAHKMELVTTNSVYFQEPRIERVLSQESSDFPETRPFFGSSSQHEAFPNWNGDGKIVERHP